MKTLWLALGLLGGCWHEEPLVDGTFTRDEWEFLSTQFVLPQPEPCAVGPRGWPAGQSCDDAARFGQVLFFEPSLSGPIRIDDPFAPGALDEPGKVACADCHAPKVGATVGFFVDTRSQPNTVSSGANLTKHNAMSVVNTAYKSVVAAQQCGADDDPELCLDVYSWTGIYESPEGVLDIAGRKAMNSNETIMATAICAATKPYLLEMYREVYNAAPDRCGGTHSDAEVFHNLALAFDAYTRRLISNNAKLDRYVAGQLRDDHTTSNASELDDHERRGLSLFIGKAMCIECHRGPLLSDLAFHNTGVAQSGPRVPSIDRGLGESTGNPLHDGQFLTPPLRHVAQTAPYMHAGQYASLAEVIEFYRRGGDPEGFSGRKDPRIQPLEIDDDEARDLEAFLRALTGAPPDARYADGIVPLREAP